MQYFEVAPLKIVRASAATFTYQSDIAELMPGDFVFIPIGKTRHVGLVMNATTKPSYETRAVEEKITTIPPLPTQLLATALWMSDYYQTHLATTLSTVLPRGLTKKRRAARSEVTYPQRDRTNFLLNNDQQAALKIIQTATPGTILVHGVTGSGKTALYIHYARELMAAGKSVVVLVPEIALTSQLVAEFLQHFQHVILTHSAQTEADRHRAWLAVANADTPQIIIGPRSALFMPVRNLGGIVIDEAHEPSFKQDQSPRYSALRVSSVLAKLHQAKVIQGSATPLVSEYYLAERSGRPVVHLHQRARSDAVQPNTFVVDMTKKAQFSKHRFFSDNLLSAIATSLSRDEQILLYHNRRGSASTTLCEACGWSAICPRCFIPYTLHTDTYELRCHVCGDHQRVPTSCPECGSVDIIHKGIGTKLIETEARRLFPAARMARFDGDVDNDATLEKHYQELYDGNVDIIIGTQVVAKGLDLPHLRTVGVIQADAGLALPDYTSSERTFQLLAQVVGRVGRSHHPTQLIVQSYRPQHTAVTLGIAQDFHTFYETALDERKKAHFPPFTYLLKLTCVYKTEAAAIRNARDLASKIRQQHHGIEIFGPTPAFYERQHDTYRWQIVVKSPLRARLIEAMRLVPTSHWQIDLDPHSLI